MNKTVNNAVVGYLAIRLSSPATGALHVWLRAGTWGSVIQERRASGSYREIGDGIERIQ